jgi:hypothetical protein
MKQNNLNRILDANFNRSREGLRVCEDICRFVLSKGEPARQLKTLRHQISAVYKSLDTARLIKSRDVSHDNGKAFDVLEKSRKNWPDIYLANMQRCKESVRVLEEVSKLTYPKKTANIKKIRFKLYELEKKHYSVIAKR